MIIASATSGRNSQGMGYRTTRSPRATGGAAMYSFVDLRSILRERQAKRRFTANH
jgi:hypothetical protein